MATMPTDASTAPAPSGRRRMTRRRTFGDLVVQFALPVAAVALLGFAGWYVRVTRPVTAQPPPPIAPARNPFGDALAAAGVVEARTENIAVGSPTAGVVVEVMVTVDDQVKPGDPLFRLDDRELRGDLAVKRAAESQAKSELVRLEAEPRKEKIPVQTAVVNEKRATVVRERDALNRAEETFARKVTTEQELIARREAFAGAQAALERAQADLDLLEAGAWQYDRDVAAAAVSRAQADVDKMEVEIDRLVVRALVAGRVLKVDVRPGEFVGAPAGQPLVILGDIERLHVRVDVDEFDIPRFRAGAPAMAVPRGSLQQRYPLQFVRIEPFVVPKKSLTGETTERVDTRVLQVIYVLDPTGLPPLFVGQQVEVYVDSVVPEGATAAGGGT